MTDQPVSNTAKRRITKKEMAKWMECFGQDRRIPKDVREIAADMAIRAGRKPVALKDSGR